MKEQNKMTISREVRLRQRPVGLPTSADFELATVEVPSPGPGEVQVKNLFMSVDPYMRGRMTDRPSYVPPFQLGATLQGGAVGEVIASGADGFEPGDIVTSMFGWREAFTAQAKHLQKIDTHGLPVQAFLGVAGMPGLTAYAGLTRVAQAKAGDIVFVSAAAGAVGQVACQVARLKGCTVIGAAGGPEKTAFLREIGVDQVIDYKAEPDLKAALRRAAPDGVDVYFENVGGDHLEAALDSARLNGRFAMCGMISIYNDARPEPGPANLALIIGKRLRLQGFIVSDHFDLASQFVAELSAWIKSGQLHYRETVDEGIAAAPGAFLKLFSGENIGKMLVKLS
jgi:NADPH-dependent curcumin reductase CurA